MKKQLLLGICILMLIGVLTGCTKTKSINEQKIVYSDELSKVKEIRIESNSKIEITASNTKDLKATLSGDIKYIPNSTYSEAMLVSKIEDEVLHINYDLDSSKKSKVTIGENLNKVSLVLDIPNSLKEKLYVKSQYGTINIKYVNFKNIDCISEIGDIAISLVKIPNSVNIKTISGAIKLNLPKNEKFNLSTITKVENIKNNLSSNVDNSLDKSKINLTTEIGKIEIVEDK